MTLSTLSDQGKEREKTKVKDKERMEKILTSKVDGVITASTTHDTKFCWGQCKGKGKGKGKGKSKGRGVKGLWTDWPEEDENYWQQWQECGEEDPTKLDQPAASTTTDHANYETVNSAASTVAAIHYSKVVVNHKTMIYTEI